MMTNLSKGGSLGAFHPSKMLSRESMQISKQSSYNTGFAMVETRLDYEKEEMKGDPSMEFQEVPEEDEVRYLSSRATSVAGQPQAILDDLNQSNYRHALPSDQESRS